MSLLFFLTAIGVVAPICFTTFIPTPIQQQATLDAKRRKWGFIQIYITRALGFLTLFTQFIVCLFLYDVTNIMLLVIAQTFSTSVFILYHGINSINPLHLAYHPEELVRAVVTWRPPLSKYFPIWIGLHYQHTFFPFYLKYYQHSNNINFDHHVDIIDALFLCCMLLLFYITWHFHCWKVQGYPAYPFLKHLREEGIESIFYSVGFAMFCCIFILIWTF